MRCGKSQSSLPMKIIHPLLAVLMAGSLHLPRAVAEDKKKDKMAEYQKNLLDAQQQWKLDQMRKQQALQGQQKAVPRPPAAVQNAGAVKLAVSNRSGVPLAIFWLAPNGGAQSFGRVEPGQPFVQETFAGHTWQFRAGRQVVKTYVASNQPVQQVVIGNIPGSPPVAIREPQDVQTGNGLIIQRQPPVLGGIREPEDVQTGNGLVIQRQPPMPAGIPEPPDVQTGNGLGIQRQPPVRADIDPGVVVNNRPLIPGLPGAESADPRVTAFLQVHNQARAEVGVGPLQWSDKLAQSAQQWADQLAGMGKIMHNPQTPYGENWAAQSGSFSPAGAAQMWLGEKVDFQPGQRGPGNAGHYTQMVWRKTTHVGFGVAVVNGMTVVVANYEPAGNYANQAPY